MTTVMDRVNVRVMVRGVPGRVVAVKRWSEREYRKKSLPVGIGMGWGLCYG